MRRRPVVVTDMREPLVAVHRRLIRRRTVLMVIWILGWVATGFVSDTAWLALLILFVTGPMLWWFVWLYYSWNEPPPREPVGRRAVTGRTVRERGAPGAGADH